MLNENIPTKFTPLQQELLNLYAMEINNEEMKEIKQLLDQYFLDRLQKKVTQSALKKGYTQEDFDHWLNDSEQ